MAAKTLGDFSKKGIVVTRLKKPDASTGWKRIGVVADSRQCAATKEAYGIARQKGEEEIIRQAVKRDATHIFDFRDVPDYTPNGKIGRTNLSGIAYRESFEF